MDNSLSTRTPRSLSVELLFSRSDPSLCWYMGLFFPWCRTLHLSWLNFKQFFPGHLSNLLRSFSRSEQDFGALTTPSSFILSAKLLTRHLPLNPSRWWIIWSIKPWGHCYLQTSSYTLCYSELTPLWALPFSQVSVHFMRISCLCLRFYWSSLFISAV